MAGYTVKCKNKEKNHHKKSYPTLDTTSTMVMPSRYRYTLAVTGNEHISGQPGRLKDKMLQYKVSTYIIAQSLLLNNQRAYKQTGSRFITYQYLLHM